MQLDTNLKQPLLQAGPDEKEAAAQAGAQSSDGIGEQKPGEPPGLLPGTPAAAAAEQARQTYMIDAQRQPPARLLLLREFHWL